jgi:hypothetical protein
MSRIGNHHHLGRIVLRWFLLFLLEVWIKMKFKNHSEDGRSPFRGWHPPKSIIEADRRIGQLEEEILEIEAQLADKDRRDANGDRFTPQDYHKWRASAIYAMNKKKQERSRLLAWKRIYRFFLDDDSKRSTTLILFYGIILNKITALLQGFHLFTNG